MEAEDYNDEEKVEDSNEEEKVEVSNETEEIEDSNEEKKVVFKIEDDGKERETEKESEVTVTVEMVDTESPPAPAPATLSSPVNVPEDLFLRPSKPQRTVTSIWLEEAFSILEDELMEEPRLAVLDETEQEVVPGEDQEQIVLQIPTKDESPSC